MLAIIQRLREKLGFAFYLRPQTYQIRCQITLTNHTQESKDFHCVVPLPRDASGQRISSPVEIFPKPQLQGRDEKYGNPYAVFEGTAEAGESFLFEYSAEIKTEPQCIESSRTFTIGEYQDVENEAQLWKGAEPHMNTRDPRVISLAEKIEGDAGDILRTVKRINKYVIKNLRYGSPIEGLYNLDQVLTRKEVDCGGFSVLFIALARALGIPARLVSGFWIGHQKNTMHAWTEVLLPDGQWLPVDTSVEYLRNHYRTIKMGKVGCVGSDRLVISYGSDIPVQVGNKKTVVGLFQHPFIAFSEEEKNFTIKTNLEAVRTS